MTKKCAVLKSIPVSVNKAVSGLDFRIATSGSLTPVFGLSLDSESVGGGVYRVLVWVTTNRTFTGKFMTVARGAISSVSNIIGSDIDGNEVADVSIIY